MLDDRKKRVLQAIVEEYVNSAEPVSSSTIVKKHNLCCSSATVRNDMMELEQIGFLDKPHTSAGRVPSSKGYKFYVDKLLQDDNITIEEIKYIKDKLQTKVNELEDLTKMVANTLTEVTHYTSLAIGPKTAEQVIVDIKFIILGKNILMAVILTDSGLIKETIIKFDEEITQGQVDNINYVFNSKLRGRPLTDIDESMTDYIMSEMNIQLNIIKPILEQINKALFKKSSVYLDGKSKVFDFPEFKEIDVAKNLLNLLDTSEAIEYLVANGISKDVNVYIGDTEDGKLKNISLVTFKHEFNGKELGTIGIIGPTRMNYSKVISIMKYISKYLNGGGV